MFKSTFFEHTLAFVVCCSTLEANPCNKKYVHYIARPQQLPHNKKQVVYCKADLWYLTYGCYAFILTIAFAAAVATIAVAAADDETATTTTAACNG